MQMRRILLQATLVLAISALGMSCKEDAAGTQDEYLPEGKRLLTGRVKDSRGVPIAEAEVMVTREEVEPGGAVLVERARTEKFGAFRLYLDEPACRYIKITHPSFWESGWKPLDRDESGDYQPVEIRLVMSGALDGAITSRGQPLIEEEVRISCGDKFDLVTMTGSEGQYRFASLPPGPCSIELFRDNFGVTVETEIGERCNTRKNIELGRLSSVRGFVTGWKPENTVLVTVLIGPGRGRAGNDGAYSIHNLPSGTHDVEVETWVPQGSLCGRSEIVYSGTIEVPPSSEISKDIVLKPPNSRELPEEVRERNKLLLHGKCGRPGRPPCPKRK